MPPSIDLAVAFVVPFKSVVIPSIFAYPSSKVSGTSMRETHKEMFSRMGLRALLHKLNSRSTEVAGGRNRLVFTAKRGNKRSPLQHGNNLRWIPRPYPASFGTTAFKRASR